MKKLNASPFVRLWVKSSIRITILAYLLAAFVKWDLLWGLSIPDYSMDSRGKIVGIMCMVVIVAGVISWIIASIREDNECGDPTKNE